MANGVFDILKTCCRPAFKESIKGKFWAAIFGTSIVTVGGFCLLLFNLKIAPNVKTSILITGTIILVLFTLRFLLLLGILITKELHDRYVESVYGHAIILLKEAFAKVHSLRKQREIKEEDIIDVALCICNNLKNIFDKKTHTNCSVSIKVPVYSSNHTAKITADHNVRNFIRDSSHVKKRDTANYMAVDHTISLNTPFLKVYNGIKSQEKQNFYYLNNNISATNEYDNTSRKVYADGVLPYNSELVYPITPSLWDSQSSYDLLGFICVDCVEAGKFNNSYDVAIMEGTADNLYDIILLWHEKFNPKQIEDATS